MNIGITRYSLGRRGIRSAGIRCLWFLNFGTPFYIEVVSSDRSNGSKAPRFGDVQESGLTGNRMEAEA